MTIWMRFYPREGLIKVLLTRVVHIVVGGVTN